MSRILPLSLFIQSILVLFWGDFVAAQIDPDGNSAKFNMITYGKSKVGSHTGDFSYLTSYDNKLDLGQGEKTYMEFYPDAEQSRYSGIFTIKTGLLKDDSITDALGEIDFVANGMRVNPTQIWKIHIRNFDTNEWEILTNNKDQPHKIWSKWAKTKKVSNVQAYFSHLGEIKIRIQSAKNVDVSPFLLDYFSIRFRFFPFWHCKYRCSVSCDDSLAVWETRMNKKCWGFYFMQGSRFGDGTLVLFGIRSTCACPARDYTISNSCEPWTQANHNHCILAEISQYDEINFGNLNNVRIRRVEATGPEMDIDFQGETQNSLFCELDAQGDVEFGGGECPIQFHENVVHSIRVGLDLQFEEGTWVGPNNVFMEVDVGDDFQFNNEALATRDAEVFDNTWGDINVDDKCNFNAPVADVSVSGNTCDWFHVDDDDDCAPVFAGFDCV